MGYADAALVVRVSTTWPVEHDIIAVMDWHKQFKRWVTNKQPANPPLEIGTPIIAHAVANGRGTFLLGSCTTGAEPNPEEGSRWEWMYGVAWWSPVFYAAPEKVLPHAHAARTWQWLNSSELQAAMKELAKGDIIA